MKKVNIVPLLDGTWLVGHFHPNHVEKEFPSFPEALKYAQSLGKEMIVISGGEGNVKEVIHV